MDIFPMDGIYDTEAGDRQDQAHQQHVRSPVLASTTLAHSRLRSVAADAPWPAQLTPPFRSLSSSSTAAAAIPTAIYHPSPLTANMRTIGHRRRSSAPISPAARSAHPLRMPSLSPSPVGNTAGNVTRMRDQYCPHSLTTPAAVVLPNKEAELPIWSVTGLSSTVDNSDSGDSMAAIAAAYGRELAVPRQRLQRRRAGSLCLAPLPATSRPCSSGGQPLDDASAASVPTTPRSFDSSLCNFFSPALPNSLDRERDTTGPRLSSPALSARRLSLARTPNSSELKPRTRLLCRVQSLLESEAQPQLQEVEKERELQHQLRDMDAEDTEDEMALGADEDALSTEAAAAAAANNSPVGGLAANYFCAPVYTRSRLNPEWDFFRGDPSPSPSSSCMSSPGLHPMSASSTMSFWSTNFSSTVPYRRKRKASCDRVDPYCATSGHAVLGLKRRAASPRIAPNSPRTLGMSLCFGAGEHSMSPRVGPHAVPVSPALMRSNSSASTGSVSMSQLSLGPPLQPLPAIASTMDTATTARNLPSLLNIQEANETFTRLSLSDHGCPAAKRSRR